MRRGLLASFLCLGMIAAAPAKKEKVLILPFSPTDPQSKLTWIGKAIKANLVTDFSKSQQFMAVSPKDAVPAEDEAEALKAAKTAGAKYVVFGSFQNQDANLRITGQILDVDTEQAVAGLRATGLIKDLFLLEDALADQARTTLPHPKTPNPVTANAAAQSQPQQPAVIVQPADLGHGLMAGTYSADDQYNRYQYQPVWPDNTYPYSYPYYYPPFPYVPTVTIIKTDRDHHFDHHDHDFDHHRIGDSTPTPTPSPTPVSTPTPQPSVPVNFPVKPGPGTPQPIAPSPIAPHNPSVPERPIVSQAPVVSQAPTTPERPGSFR